jgi:hypothetical protein
MRWQLSTRTSFVKTGALTAVHMHGIHENRRIKNHTAGSFHISLHVCAKHDTEILMWWFI